MKAIQSIATVLIPKYVLPQRVQVGAVLRGYIAVYAYIHSWVVLMR